MPGRWPFPRLGPAGPARPLPATGNLGADRVAKSPADGYTLPLADIGSLAIAPGVFPQLAFDPVRDFAPVIMLACSPHILAAHPPVPAKHAKERVALAKGKPGALNSAISGLGSAKHMAGIGFAMRAGIQWACIPYKRAAPRPGTPAQFGASIRGEMTRWAKVVKDSGAMFEQTRALSPLRRRPA